MTHDSIGVGEDGPTHQPVEVCALLRATPNITLLRPADQNEVNGSYQYAVENLHGPTVIALTRQNVPTLLPNSSANVSVGAYTILKVENPQVILIATGSEVGP